MQHQKKEQEEDIYKILKNEMPYEEILESVKNRDFIDSTREIAPLKKADDAIYVDSSNMTIDEVVERIKKIISEKRK